MTSSVSCSAAERRRIGAIAVAARRGHRSPASAQLRGGDKRPDGQHQRASERNLRALPGVWRGGDGVGFLFGLQRTGKFQRAADSCASTKIAPPAMEPGNDARPARIVTAKGCCRNTRPSRCASPPASTPAPASSSAAKARPARRTPPGDLYIITNVAPTGYHAQGRQHLLRRSHHAARGGAGREDRGADS